MNRRAPERARQLCQAASALPLITAIVIHLAHLEHAPYALAITLVPGVLIGCAAYYFTR